MVFQSQRTIHCKYIGAWGLTEPNTGSDASKMSSTAIRKGNKWVLNGTKNFITHGKSGDISVVVFRTGPVGEKNNSTAFVIEKGIRGLQSGKKENKLGIWKGTFIAPEKWRKLN